MKSGASVKPRIAILISGTGSNMEAILSACKNGSLDADPAIVISDCPEAAGLKKARARGVKTLAFPYSARVPREENEAPILHALRDERVEWVVLAGFMKILTPDFVRAFRDRIVNIHPSLLPSFPGAHAIADVIGAKCDVTGVTIHIVDELIDHGTIVAQTEVAIMPGDTEETLAQRIHAAEHKLYPRTLQQLFHEDF
ncbi:MAG: phosphoribosylglycinamide formyltransferase [Synergistaceae bacterium]|jgi:formyltetrahydrofolate-dependent phosphoribosylglycinamide formyltransferase|nr:phosphoribosylglycinamide formyltransferase [Synergistaceae bacterium]